MSCDNCKDMTAHWCPVCQPPTKPAICELCHDPMCPCGKVGFHTDAELIAALRVCRDGLARKFAAKDAEIDRLRELVRDAYIEGHRAGGDAQPVADAWRVSAANDARGESLDSNAVVACRTQHIQACHVCTNFDCGDNTTQAGMARKKAARASKLSGSES